VAKKLTQREADMLIEMLKKTVEKEVALPSGKGRVEFDVIGERKEDRFAVNIERKGIDDKGASYQGRARFNGVILIRLDVNPTNTHVNPDGEKITGTHIHVYTEEHDMRMAMPFDVANKDLYQLCYTFFERFHIIEPPEITQQLSFSEV
jgi:hypothetical protein